MWKIRRLPDSGVLAVIRIQASGVVQILTDRSLCRPLHLQVQAILFNGLKAQPLIQVPGPAGGFDAQAAVVPLGVGLRQDRPQQSGTQALAMPGGQQGDIDDALLSGVPMQAQAADGLAGLLDNQPLRLRVVPLIVLALQLGLVVQERPSLGVAPARNGTDLVPTAGHEQLPQEGQVVSALRTQPGAGRQRDLQERVKA